MESLNKYKITVLIISYNQNDVIGRALDSVLIQKDFGLYEIVICDDCSTDNNWEIITEYKEKYPDIIRAYRNEVNLGIYSNAEKLVSLRGDADIFYMLSGDDALCNGILREAQLLIKRENIDINNEAVALYFDWKNVFPNGKERIYQNNLISNGLDPFSLKHRGLIYNRSVFLSGKVLKQFKPVPKDNLSFSEDIFDKQFQLYAEKNYYHPFVGSIYYSGIGISTKLKSKEFFTQEINNWERYLSMYDFTYKDRMFSYYKIHYFKFRINPSFAEFCQSLKYYCKGFTLKYGIKRDDFLLFRSMVKILIINIFVTFKL